MRTCAHVPEIATICSMIKGRGAFETKGLICAIGNLLLLISGRQAHRAFMPAGMLVLSLMKDVDIKFMHENPCVSYPGFDYSRIRKFNFSGQSSFVAYNRINHMTCPEVLGKFSSQIFFHSVWGTYCEDLGVLQWMTTGSEAWSNRADMGDCFRSYGTCSKTISFSTPKFKYYSKLCSASNSGLLGRREQQTINSYVFAGKREQKFCTTFLESLKETNQASTAVRKDIPSLTKMIQETTNKLIELIRKKNRVIEMGNAPYHSMLEDNFPKSNARKADIQEWLNKKNIDFSPLETVAELRERVKVLIPTEKKYELDELALKMGHEVVRLPPYHCQYNPIEIIWAQVKGQVASKNTTFKMADVEKLMHEAIDSVKKENWVNCVRHAERIQDEDYQKEKHREVILEPIILTIRPGDSSSDDDDEEDDI
ncbi:uncharacterized protein LOC112681484 [Sipha flava]|uniref:Uncharacterized protein LOC112681484 n=1 Tax=Sipha flava TaxID=143950 RepID=A0A2S2QQZ6_9HEMI|nr:uncharacterized protein LOC112681484 [Sipha flava]